MHTKQAKTKSIRRVPSLCRPPMTQPRRAASVTGLFFGVDSDVPANELLQNNLTLFEWAVRNKLYPNFWGRSITGEQALTRGEIDFLHDQGCRIAAIYRTSEPKETEEQGRLEAGKAASCRAGAGNSI